MLKMEEEIKNNKKWKKLIEFKWKDDLFWILFFGLLFFSAYAWKLDMNICKPYIEDPCGMCENLTLQQAQGIGTYNKILLNNSLNISKNETE